MAEPVVHLDLYGCGAPPEIVLLSFPASLHNRITVYPRLTSQPIADGLVKAKVFFFPRSMKDSGMGFVGGDGSWMCACDDTDRFRSDTARW